MQPGWAASLDMALAHAWQRLEGAVADRASPLRLPVLATVDEAGAPQARTVVLRAADAESWCLHIHTDGRSAKARQLAADSRVSLLFYDPVEKLQLRVGGRAILHRDGEIVRSAWAGSAPATRRAYFAEQAPGTPVGAATSGLPSDPVVFADEERAIAAFTVVELAVERLEWLLLGSEGHRRAAHERGADGAVTSTWLVP